MLVFLTESMSTDTKKEIILQKIRELYQEEIEFVDGDKKDVDAASKYSCFVKVICIWIEYCHRSNKKIKCPYIKCQKECKEN